MSVSASAENLSTDAQSCDGGSMCLELALEGERLCKAGDCRAGVAFFQAAIQAGTDDLRTLSAIYSQLGNAYFYLGDYNKAMQYHKHDLTLARTMNDKLGEAKASGNLGNTLKVMGKFTEAIQCCKRHLEISRSLADRLSEGRALYNLGNVYHAQGKQLGRVGQNDPGHFPQEVRDCLENLDLMRSLEDRQAMGRACGNLGNTCYLLGEFPRAIRYHTERLRIAREFGDRPAERRANSNLANSHIFLGQFENAAEHYKRTLALAEESGDAAVEAQACYSLGNTYTLLREYRAAEHARQSRKSALGDVLGVATAQMNISDLRKVLGLPAEQAPVPAAGPADSAPRTPCNALRVRRQSMEQLSLIQITPDAKSKGDAEQAESPVESFLELLSRCQSARIDDQRATLAQRDKENRPEPTHKLQRSHSSGNKHSRTASARIDDQRATLAQRDKENRPQPAHKLQRSHSRGNKHSRCIIELLSRCQSARIDDQRATLAQRDKENRPEPTHKLQRSHSSGNKHSRTAVALSVGAHRPPARNASAARQGEQAGADGQTATVA
ncbi:G-protein-signaling modulator 2 [Operophtera brumata]|uniref:G-protein-signaling modulator 2 n=1 Tax=Operophtera brumata TaxID=104452 RepID=A0A0L7LAY8_OPEBR|nr:G-protein-signaling modulator 2 [Operophtera brumata]